MFEGGPMTVFAMFSKCCTFGGNVAKSRIEMESGAVPPGITRGAPEIRSILFSLPERTSCALKGCTSALAKSARTIRCRLYPGQTLALIPLKFFGCESWEHCETL